MLARNDETLPELKDITPTAAPPAPPEPPIVEKEWQPPSRRKSNLKYQRSHAYRYGREFRVVSVIAKPGRVIEQVDRWYPLDGGKDTVVFTTRRTTGKPPSGRNGKVQP